MRVDKKIKFFLKLIFLGPFALIFYIVIFLRNLLYKSKFFKTYRLDKPVLSVGNISVGGAGKTPLVMFLMQTFENKNIAVLSRGYGSQVAKEKSYPQSLNTSNKANYYGDEPSLIYQNFPKQSVILDSDRYRGGKWHLEKSHPTDFFILDDGYQHRRLYRDLNYVVFDVDAYMKTPFLLPLGRFREPLSELKRADLIFLSKCNAYSESEINKLKIKIESISKTQVCRLENKILKLKSLASSNALIESKNTQTLKPDCNKNILVFCAIGSPESFVQDLKAYLPKANFLQPCFYADHYQYEQHDIDFLLEHARSKDAVLICTEKDYIKFKKINISLNEIYVAYAGFTLCKKALDLVHAQVRNLI